MAVSDDQIAFALELFEGLGPLTTRKMMGGLCLYHEGTIFAILSAEGEIYLKAKGAIAEEIAAAGSRQFSITRDDGSVATNSYWTLPEAALDDPDVAADWARRALAVL